MDPFRSVAVGGVLEDLDVELGKFVYPTPSQAIHVEMGYGRMYGLPAEVSEDIWTWWRFLKGIIAVTEIRSLPHNGVTQIQGVIRDNNFCRPVASLENVTKSFQLLIIAHRCDVTQVCLIHFTLFGRSIHQLLRHDDPPLAYPALKRSKLTPTVSVGIACHQPI